MKRFKKLLVHLDLEGPHDDAAIRYASAVSRMSQSRRISFVHTEPTRSLLPGYLDDSPAPVAQWVPHAKAELEAKVRRFRGPEESVVKIQVLGGAGFQDLLEHLRSGNPDLVFVGKSPDNVRFVEKLTRKAPCSVMIVPPGKSVVYRRILVSTDFSSYSARAMEVAVAFAQARKLKKVVCFNAYPIAFGQQRSGIPPGQFHEETQAWHRKLFDDFRQPLDLAGVQVEFVCRESSVAATGILMEAERLKTDLLVMGARGKDALAEALLGSTTAQVVRESPIATLVVKPKGAGASLLNLLLGEKPA